MQILEEIGKMAGCSALQLVRKAKTVFLQGSGASNLQIRSLDAPCGLRLVTDAEFDLLAKFKLVVRQKDL